MGLKRPPSLGAGLVAVQAVDFGWVALNYAGLERAEIQPGYSALSSIHLAHMPYTHSLPAALIWSVAGALIYRLIDRRGGWGPALVIGALVFSHWLLDFLVHQPDLLLFPGGPMVGLGWWTNAPLGIAAEMAVLLGGFLIYAFSTRARSAAGNWAPWALLALLVGVQCLNWFGPTPPDIWAMLPQALAAYTLIAAAGFWLDRVREPKTITATG
jgi:hypothetical protein